ncbi:MAG: low molecular weight phosphotyrosine protein phosphatase [Deltaproteobacteria bacterium]|nr:low molecular weight phosphotyrosine protein phosphatase [Deltaproteobacteria bacterium]
MAKEIGVLFVCLGNICRSPQAEGIFRKLVADAGLRDRFDIDSAGTGGWHAGEAPDWRTQAASERHGIPLPHRARLFEVGDFDRFDHILAMDRSNLRDILALARDDADRHKVRLLRELDPLADVVSVPDPYYGDGDGFERVFQICLAACRGLLRELTARHRRTPSGPIDPA